MPLLLMVHLACAPPINKDADTGLGDPRIELGTGEWEWESLVGATEIEIVQGPQGGFHFVGSVRTSGLHPGNADDLSDPDNPTTSFTVLVNGEDITMTGTYTQGLQDAPREAQPYRNEMLGRFVIVDILSDDELSGQDIEMTVVVTDVHGTELTSSRHLVAIPHPFNL